jgi:glucose/arabinose dehydrogenase
MKANIILLSIFLSFTCFSQVPKIELITFAQGLSKPVDIKNCGDSRLFVVEQTGRIRIVKSDGSLVSTPFLNITSKVNSSGNEQGLLSMAFSPNYKTDGFFFVNYIAGSGNGSSILARYSVNSNDSNLANEGSEKILLQFDQPYNNHNGSDIRFGPDGYLYVTFGDGGSGGDPQARAQNTNSFFGKVLRINPFKGTLYEIPHSNPFYGQTDKKQEIWAYGLRNPWRCSFDRLTGDYWIGDVGQNVYEEIDFQPASSTGGENYGWRCYEANSSYNSSGCSANLNNFVFPVYTYEHSASNGCAVTGGYVYRGSQYQNMFGKYFFTDYCSGRIWYTDKNGLIFSTSVINNYLTNQYSSFGENYVGELFLTGIGNGNIYQLRDTASCKPVAFLSNKDTIYACGSSYVLNTPYGPGLSYSWSFDNANIESTNENLYTAKENGKYAVKVSNTMLCESVDTVVVSLNNGTTVNISNLQPTFCNNDNAVSLNATPGGGVFTINDTLAVTNFDAGALGVGIFVVKYTYINDFKCVNTDTKPVTVSLCTGLNETDASQFHVSVAPNPGNGKFRLDIYSAFMQMYKIRVFDMLGREVFNNELIVSPGNQSLPLDLEHLIPGTYFIMFNGIKMNVSLKINIQK